MSTLSVKVYTVAGGRTESLACGPNFNCPDPRDEFYQQTIVGKTMEALSFSGDGCRYTLYKINGGRGDASEACIFIPKDINAEQSPLMQIVSILKNVIESGSLSEEQKTEIEQLCAVQCPGMRNIVPSFGSQMAALYYGDSLGLTLSQILCDVFRPEFKGNRMIFLSDNPEVRYAAREISSSAIKVRSIIEVRCPGKDPKGFVPTIDGDPFIRNQYMFQGTPFVVEWTKKYWHPITMNLVASESLSPKKYLPKDSQYKRTRNNPLYTTLWIVSAVAVVTILSIITINIIRGNNLKEEQETRLQSMINGLDFDIDFSDFQDVDNRLAWERAVKKAQSLENKYQYKVWKAGDAYAPTDVEAFCKVVEAASYLDQHTEWVRSEMEELDSLKGFFEFVNSYDIVLAQKKGAVYIQRFKGISNVNELLSLNPRPGLSGTCSSTGRIVIADYKEKVEGSASVFLPNTVKAGKVSISSKDKVQPTESTATSVTKPSVKKTNASNE